MVGLVLVIVAVRVAACWLVRAMSAGCRTAACCNIIWLFAQRMSSKACSDVVVDIGEVGFGGVVGWFKGWFWDGVPPVVAVC